MNSSLGVDTVNFVPTNLGEPHRFTTETTRAAGGVVGAYCGRRSIGTAFPECRSCVGLGTTRGRCRRTARRAAPRLFGMDSVVAAVYHLRSRSGGVVRQGKARYLGFSEWNAEQIRASQQTKGEHFVSSQPQYSMLWRVPEEAVIPHCAKTGIA